MTEIDDTNKPWDTFDVVLCALRNFFAVLGFVAVLGCFIGWITG